jgi:hypothetical protein
MPNSPEMGGAAIEITQRERLGRTLRSKNMRFSARDQDEITIVNTQRSSLLEYNGRRSSSKIVEHRV